MNTRNRAHAHGPSLGSSGNSSGSSSGNLAGAVGRAARALAYPLLLCGLVGCGAPDPAAPDAVGGALVASAQPMAGAETAETTARFAWPACGGATFDYTELYYGSAIAVAPDGTVYHSHYDAGESFISRYRPGQPVERNWARLGPSGPSAFALAVDPAGTPYALVASADGKQAQIGRVVGGAPPAIVPLGAAVPRISGPTSLAFTHDSVLLEAGFQGVAKIDRTTGRRTQVSPPLQLRELYFVGPRTARGVTYDHGLVELTFDSGVTRSTYRTIFPFDTLALQYTGADQLGRTYALIHEMSTDKLVRFDPSFRTRETLYEYRSVPIALGRLAFGRGALRCDVLLTGFSVGRVIAGSTPGVP